MLFSFTYTERERGEEAEAVVGTGDGRCREDFNGTCRYRRKYAL